MIPLPAFISEPNYFSNGVDSGRNLSPWAEAWVSFTLGCSLVRVCTRDRLSSDGGSRAEGLGGYRGGLATCHPNPE